MEQMHRGWKLEPGVWHRGCWDCGEQPDAYYKGKKCKHPGAVQGTSYLRGKRATFVPDGVEPPAGFPSPDD